MYELPAAPRLNLTVDHHLIVLNANFGLEAVLGKFCQFQKLAEADWLGMNVDGNWFYFHSVVF